MACAALAGAPSFVSAAPADTTIPGLASDEERGFTVPTDEVELGFNLPGLVKDVKVKDGDVVKKGQLLAQQDTEVEEAELAKQDFLLKSNVQLLAATAQRELAEVTLQRKEKLRKQDAASLEEYEQAKLEVTVAKLKEELAREETESKRLDILKLKKQIDRMKLVAPADGVIRKVESAVGEVSDPQKPSIVLVRNDKLKVEVKLPIRMTTDLKLKQVLQVKYLGEDKWRQAPIIYFDPVADATVEGGSQLVHLELPNPEARRAGQDVIVKLPENVAAAK